jgi:hypothetical protein
MWRVRRKNERGFNDGFHLNNGEGARQLVELLNKQDNELAAVTCQRDRLAENLERALNATVLNHRRDRWHIDAEYTLQLIQSLNQP